jgi:hypothetical protein
VKGVDVGVKLKNIVTHYVGCELSSLPK